MGYGRIVALGSGVTVAVLVGGTAVGGAGVAVSGVGLRTGVWVETAVAKIESLVSVGKSAMLVGVGRGDDWQAPNSSSTLKMSRCPQG